MNALRDALAEYVALRRALGTKLLEPALALGHFVQFLEREGATYITTELAVRWACQPQGVQAATWARRLTAVRRFSSWLSAFDPRTEVPPRRLIAARHRRKKPYIYSDQEIEQLIAEAGRLPSPNGMRALTHGTLIGLLAATGLRPGEALSLDSVNVDLENGILAIRQTKFDKSRFVPIDDSTRTALARYSKERDRLCPGRQTEAFLVSERGTRLHAHAARRTFAKVCCAIGLRVMTGRRIGRGPRLQDLRHTFATRRLVEWYRAGLDVQREMPKLTTYLGHVAVANTYWYIEAVPELLQLATERSAAMQQGKTVNTPNFSALLQRFFVDRLVGQLGASPHTIAGYRGTFRLLLRFASEHVGRAPSDLRMEDLDAAFLGKFLDHLERNRGNCPRTRNTRLAAVRAFFRFVSLTEPALALHCQRVLAIPSKRYERGPVEFLSEEETAALVAAPDPGTWIGRRDRAILLLAVQTGLRNSELRGLRRQDVEFGAGAHVGCVGKGRKTRCTPLRPDVAAVLKAWLSERVGSPGDPVFPNSHGRALSADALQRLVARHIVSAARACPSLAAKTVTPHTLRHTAAMDLLRRGVDLSVIALWLGHESTETTQVYLHADMRLKEQALAHATSSGVVPERFVPEDPLLAFLESL